MVIYSLYLFNLQLNLELYFEKKCLINVMFKRLSHDNIIIILMFLLCKV